MINSLMQKIMGLVGVAPKSQPTKVASVSAPKVSPPKQGPALGGYQKMELKAAAPIQAFLQTNMKEVENMSLVSYEKQVVNGFNHRLSYAGKGNAKMVVTVYQSIERQLKVMSNEIQND